MAKIVFSKISRLYLAHISCFSWKLSIVDKCHPCVLKFILGWKKEDSCPMLILNFESIGVLESMCEKIRLA